MILPTCCRKLFSRECLQIFTMCLQTVPPTGTTIRNPVTCSSFGTPWNGLMLWYIYLVSLCLSDNRKFYGDIEIHLYSLLMYKFQLVFIIKLYDYNVFTRAVSPWPIVQRSFIQLLSLNLSYIYSSYLLELWSQFQPNLAKKKIFG